MTLRHLGRAFSAIWRVLLTIQQGVQTIMSQLDDLKAADAAEASAVLAALGEIKSMSAQHATDLERLSALASAGNDVGPMVASMQSRATALNDAVAALHTTVAAAAAPAADPAPAATTGTAASGTAAS